MTRRFRAFNRRAAGLGAAVVLACGVGIATPAAAQQPTQPPDIDVAAVQKHLEELQAVADANGGNRAAGEPGYAASVDYIATQLKDAGYEVERQACTDCTGQQANLIAEYPGDTQPEQVLMLGGHLDSVQRGAGINDNGSGSAALLEIALTAAERNPELASQLRFAWWTAEETGLEGSRYYVEQLGQAELDRIEAYLNFDMLGSTNAGYFVYDGAQAAQDAFGEYFAGIGLQPEAIDLGGRSDHAAFADAGVPVGGLFSGAGATKTQAQADAWGGTAGEPYDPCYHQACDDLSNIDATALDRMADAAAYATWTLAG